MSPVKAALERLLHSPRLPEYAERIQHRLAEEREIRDRFYREMADDQKVELINGEVILYGPFKYCHLNASRNLALLLGVWVLYHHAGVVLSEKALCIFPRNDYQPDIVYFGPKKSEEFHPDTDRFPIPDFIAEILAEDTEERDRGVKFEDYAACGVREYWIVDPKHELLEQYLLAADGFYKLNINAATGEVTSVVIEGLTIPIRAIFERAAKRDAFSRIVSKASAITQ